MLIRAYNKTGNIVNWLVDRGGGGHEKEEGERESL